MRIGRFSVAQLVVAALLILATLAMAGCSSLGGDQNTFSPAGDVAESQLNYFYIVLAPAVVILIGVMAVLLYSLYRYRRRSDDEPLPKQVHGNDRLEYAWTIAPAILLIAIAIPTVIGIFEIGRAPRADALHVRVEAFQWDWQFVYLDPEYEDANGEPLTSPELYIPVGREIGVELESSDVIHSFWVPRLAGKLDIVPGRTNEMWFNATEAGTFAAQCAEFCGIGHAIMRFDVIAQPPDEFEAWAAEQLSGQTATAEGGGGS